MNDTITTTTTFTIAGMTCGHCVNAVTEELSKLEGVIGVHVDLATGTATVDSHDQISPAAIVAAVDEAGYELGS